MKNKPPGQQRALESSVGFDLRTMTDRDLERIKSYYYGMISENDMKNYGDQIFKIRDELFQAEAEIVFAHLAGDHQQSNH